MPSFFFLITKAKHVYHSEKSEYTNKMKEKSYIPQTGNADTLGVYFWKFSYANQRWDHIVNITLWFA